MILGMSTSAFMLLHVVISLVGIVAGFVALFGMFRSERLDGWTAIFLVTTILTSATGFFFPRDQVLPSHIVGALSLLVLAVAVLAFYGYRLKGAWRWVYVASAMVALYFNVFVGVFQAFQKVPFLQSFAPCTEENHYLGCEKPRSCPRAPRKPRIQCAFDPQPPSQQHKRT